ncbi:unnamed protein product [Clonostachys solani]|uniref:Uncharacterized protein n=1 Tax=Clonostachys solani TaxID=160281 RepID=A0A9N9W9Z5_9HYPO|nr:unnamed protein product [Clonostachys solani]
MSASTAEALILQHPTNSVNNPLYVTGSDKAWARDYEPIKRVITHTFVGSDGITYANFEDAFLGLHDDDALRFRQPAVPPNNRHWRLESEADCENWFNTEITNVVLSAWHSYPPMTQTSHTKPLLEQNTPENVDSTFSVKFGQQRRTVAIGEIKRNLIDTADWQRGSITAASQRKLSQELRGAQI